MRVLGFGFRAVGLGCSGFLGLGFKVLGFFFWGGFRFQDPLRRIWQKKEALILMTWLRAAIRATYTV